MIALESPLWRACCGGALGALAAWPLRRLADGLARRPTSGPALAAACTMVGAAAAAQAADPLVLAASLGLGLTLAALAAIDLTVLRLPDALTLPLLAAGLLLGPLAAAPLGARLAGAAIGYLALVAVNAFYRWRRGRDGLGRGDAKLLAACGAWLGWDRLPQVVLLACAVGLAVAAARRLRLGRDALRQPLPFGPGLCAAGFLVWMLRQA